MSLAIAICIAVVAGNNAKKMLENENSRHKAYREVAAKDGIASLLVQACEPETESPLPLQDRRRQPGGKPQENHPDQAVAYLGQAAFTLEEPRQQGAGKDNKRQVGKTDPFQYQR
ncbi:hypothetical protein EDC52_101618 [Biostraticola tofi]|uniref:Uncharacterized protein n=1 Tax=Biostraticola tofi TaxID=466109 RepID=A0A4R3Z5C8_9GAMM|nr:hypothetical protein EDC52_101618 [Biostraticola tofi]